MTDTKHDEEDRRKAMEENRENTIRIDAIVHGAYAAGFVWFLFNGLINGSVEILEQVMPRMLALTYTGVIGIGILLLFVYRATTGKIWFRRFSLTEDLWRGAHISILYGVIFYILLVHAIIIPVFSMLYFIEASVTLWISAPVTVALAIGYSFSILEILKVLAKRLRVKGA